jgi:drug/metabolite transporter (DMT)-like permease
MILQKFEKIGEYINNRSPDDRFAIVIIFAMIIVFCEAIAQSSMKHYSKNKPDCNKIFIAIGIIGYMCVSLFLYTSYKYENIGHMNMIWSCMSIIIAYIAGYTFFNETFNKYTCLSIVFAGCAIYLGHLSDEASPHINIITNTNN